MRIIGLIVVGLLAGCLPVAQQSSYGSGTGSYAMQSSGTGVYVNGQQLTGEEKAQLESIVGEVVPAGRYWIDAQGNAGYEGQPARVNLVALARQRQQDRRGNGGSKKPFNMYSTDSSGRGSSIVSEGGCTILSTPSGSLSSGC